VLFCNFSEVKIKYSVAWEIFKGSETEFALFGIASTKAGFLYVFSLNKKYFVSSPYCIVSFA